MKIVRIEFIKSSREADDCPPPDHPEFAFAGRSNVGKSSLLNMIAGSRTVSRTSSTPGKTQLINHFLINGEWYLVDLPGYGYARVSKKMRKEFLKTLSGYLLRRSSLLCLFLLVDIRLDPQASDLQFMEWLGENRVPFALCFTKSDKLSRDRLSSNIQQYKTELLNSWESLPDIFITSAVKNTGREALLDFMETVLKKGNGY